MIKIFKSLENKYAQDFNVNISNSLKLQRWIVKFTTVQLLSCNI